MADRKKIIRSNRTGSTHYMVVQAWLVLKLYTWNVRKHSSVIGRLGGLLIANYPIQVMTEVGRRGSRPSGLKEASDRTRGMCGPARRAEPHLHVVRWLSGGLIAAHCPARHGGK
jgi:hypothetical protein